jgi:predicted nucleic acid-binding protein
MSGTAPTPAPVVVDASVGLKWYITEPHSGAAALLLGGAYEPHVPSHFYVEVASTLWKKVVLRGELTEDQAREVRAALDEVPVVSHPTSGLLDEAFEVALATRRTVYDCLYVALAERLGCVAVTADERLYNATLGGPYAARVHWVGDPL